MLTHLGHGEGSLVVVGEEVAALGVVAQLVALLHRGDLQDGVDQGVLVVLALHAGGAAVYGAPRHFLAIAAGNKQQRKENTKENEKSFHVHWKLCSLFTAQLNI